MTYNEFWKSRDPKIIIARTAIVAVGCAVIWFGVLKKDIPDFLNFSQVPLEVRGISVESSPLASDDMKLVKNGSKYEVIGTLKKTSAEPEQSYFSFHVVLVDENGKYLTDDPGSYANTKSMSAFSNGSTAHFQKTFTVSRNEKPVAAVFDRINEISLADWNVEKAESNLSTARYKLKNGEYGSAKYYAELTLELSPDNEEAKAIIAEAEIKAKENPSATAEETPIDSAASPTPSPTAQPQAATSTAKTGTYNGFHIFVEDPVLNPAISWAIQQGGSGTDLKYPVLTVNADNTFKIETITMNQALSQVIAKALETKTMMDGVDDMKDAMQQAFQNMGVSTSSLKANVATVSGKYTKDGDYLDCEVTNKSSYGYKGDDLLTFRLYKSDKGYIYLGDNFGFVMNFAEFYNTSSPKPNYGADYTMALLSIKYSLNWAGVGADRAIFIDGIEVEKIEQFDTKEYISMLKNGKHTLTIKGWGSKKSIDFVISPTKNEFYFKVTKGGFGEVQLKLEDY